ncbi:MAG: ComEC/Rec2 family competence protein [Pseudobdellovibrionaceae bacterium]
MSQSFLCGVPLIDSEAKEIFRKTSLLHLMVVSGGHLQILTFLILFPWPATWRKKKYLQIFLWGFLCSYCLLTGFQPPLVRALLARFVHFLNQRFHFFWDLGKTQWLAGVLTLLLIPEWIFSFSFYLSWLASLGFLLTPLLWKFQSRKIFLTLLSCFFIQSLMTVSLGDFSALGIFTNAFLAPFIGLLLFPLSLSSVLFPFLIPVSDQLWEYLLLLLKYLAAWNFQLNSISNLPQFTQFRWFFLWGFLALIHTSLEAFRQMRYQRSNV